MLDGSVFTGRGQGDLLAALESDQREQAAMVAPVKARRDRLTQERDGIQQRLDRLVDLVATGEALGKAIAPKIAELQLAINGLEREIATCDGQLADSSMI